MNEFEILRVLKKLFEVNCFAKEACYSSYHRIIHVGIETNYYKMLPIV
jgi:hypothetical protein